MSCFIDHAILPFYARLYHQPNDAMLSNVFKRRGAPRIDGAEFPTLYILVISLSGKRPIEVKGFASVSKLKKYLKKVCTKNTSGNNNNETSETRT
jgi:hypothetical protein